MIWLSALRRSATQRVLAPLLIVVAVAMIVLGKIDQVVFQSLRLSVADNAAPILAAVARPLAAIEHLADRVQAVAEVYRENHRLKEENERLLRWQQAALSLAAENAQLRQLLKLTPEPTVSFVSARVIASSGGAYLRNLLVDAGREAGVARGQAAITGDGLVGRVYDVGSRTARVLLITDLNSRVPVIVERSRQRAILAGDNSPEPGLWYLDPAAPLKIGDRIVTSGEGGVFPPGLPVGVVVAVGAGPARVDPYVRLSRLEYLRVVDFGLADLPPPPAVGAPARRAAGAAVAARSQER